MESLKKYIVLFCVSQILGYRTDEDVWTSLGVWSFAHSYREVGLSSIIFTFQIRFGTCDGIWECEVSAYFILKI